MAPRKTSPPDPYVGPSGGRSSETKPHSSAITAASSISSSVIHFIFSFSLPPPSSQPSARERKTAGKSPEPLKVWIPGGHFMLRPLPSRIGRTVEASRHRAHSSKIGIAPSSSSSGHRTHSHGAGSIECWHDLKPLFPEIIFRFRRRSSCAPVEPKECFNFLDG